MGSDCTSCDEVHFEENPTLREFVDWVLKTYPNDFGSIGRLIEYNCGKILVNRAEDKMDQTISISHRSGGWGETDYNIHFVDEREIKVKHQFKPFDKVLVRYGNDKWLPAFYINYDEECKSHHVIGDLCYWEQCIPYEGNEHLLGTNDSPDQ